MIELSNRQDLTRLRRLALSAQGLLQAQPFGRGLAGARAAVQHLGYVQIDTISVVERAHHHVLHARVPQFSSVMTNQLLRDGAVFEYWAHAAAFLPIEDFRFSLPYKQAIKAGQTHWQKSPDRKLMAELLVRIRAEGPLRSRDLESNAHKGAGWWNWKPAKRALEQLYMQGDLMVSDRSGFQKTYDLTERVLPPQVDTTLPSIAELAAHLVDQQSRSHAIVSLKGLTYLRRSPQLRQAVKALVESRLAQGLLESIRLPTGDVFLLETGALEQTIPPANRRMVILSPFDNSVIQRERLKTLFQFDYQIECYVPADKRRFGYFCLPLLFRDQFVGRMDCKVHRTERHLEIKSLHFEATALDEEPLLDALATALQRFCHFQGCDRVSVMRVSPRRLLDPVRTAVAASQ